MHNLLALSQAMDEAVLAGQLSQGPHVERFEKAWSEISGNHVSVAVSSGFAALHLGLAALKVKGVTHAVLPPVSTCQAPYHACKAAGIDIHFQDVRENGVGYEEPLQLKVAPEKTALITLSLFGALSRPSQALLESGVHWVDDAAQSALSLSLARKGTGSVFRILSFYPTKGCCAVDGGMVLTDDQELGELVRFMRSYDTHDLESELVRYNYRMQNICAASGLASLSELDAVIIRLKNIRATFDACIVAQEGVSPLQREDDIVLSKYVIRFTSPSQALRFKKHLNEKGIEASSELLPLVNDLSAFPNAKDLLETSVSLPFHCALADVDVEKIITGSKSFFG